MNVVSPIKRLVDRFPAARRLGDVTFVAKSWQRILEIENRRRHRDAYAKLRAHETRLAPATQQVPGLLSLVTTVWNTDPAYLGILAESVRAQAGGTHFEWLILDNGSNTFGTICLLRELARLPFVRFARVEENLGIIGGMRWCLDTATGRYIMPLDSDDYLYSDCILRVTEAIRENDYPPLLYTDEDLLVEERIHDSYHKPDWDPVLFSDSCYIAHMGVIERSFALELGAYTDPSTEGSHDWDTFTRFVNAGVEPVHIPHVLYSWRMHVQSTSAAIHCKPYVFESQKTVLTRQLQGAVHPERFWMDKSPLFAGTPDWRIRSTETNPKPISLIRIESGHPAAVEALPDSAGFPVVRAGSIPEAASLADLCALVDAIDPATLVCLAWDRLAHDRQEWAWDAYTYLECFSDAVAVGGPVFGPGGHVLCAGIVFGFGRGIDSPDRGRPRDDPGFFAQMWKHRSVSAVTSQNVVVRAEFLSKLLRAPESVSFGIHMLGPLIGAWALRWGLRVIYSPFVSSTAQADWEDAISQQEVDRFISAFPEVIPDDRYYSGRFSLAVGHGYRISSDAERELHLSRLRGAARTGASQ